MVWFSVNMFKTNSKFNLDNISNERNKMGLEKNHIDCFIDLFAI